jgi:tRNA A58 N-methylase Trm61
MGMEVERNVRVVMPFDGLVVVVEAGGSVVVSVVVVVDAGAGSKNASAQ